MRHITFLLLFQLFCMLYLYSLSSERRKKKIKSFISLVLCLATALFRTLGIYSSTPLHLSCEIWVLVCCLPAACLPNKLTNCLWVNPLRLAECCSASNALVDFINKNASSKLKKKNLKSLTHIYPCTSALIVYVCKGLKINLLKIHTNSFLYEY